MTTPAAATSASSGSPRHAPAPCRRCAEFGGYGWRLGSDGSGGFITRSGESLVVERVGEPRVVVTVDDASRRS